MAVIVGISLSASVVIAQESGIKTSVDEERDESQYYQQPSYRPNARAIIHQKAQTRSYQRQSRLAALNWYGMSNGRPTAAPTPFTSLYSPVWQMPGGRPFAWHARNWPAYVVYVR
ncbi:MAG: hypothetical protein WD738_00495 [Pirellulales bacterium]